MVGEAVPCGARQSSLGIFTSTVMTRGRARAADSGPVRLVDFYARLAAFDGALYILSWLSCVLHSVIVTVLFALYFTRLVYFFFYTKSSFLYILRVIPRFDRCKSECGVDVKRHLCQARTTVRQPDSVVNVYISFVYSLGILYGSCSLLRCCVSPSRCTATMVG